MMQTDDPYMFMRGNESFSPNVFPDPKSTTAPASTSTTTPSNPGIVPLDKKPFKCSHCSKAFLYSSSLTAHEMMMHRSDLPYECRDCGRRFSLNTHLERHQMIHTGERSYQCEECGKTFLHQRYVNAHVRRIHNISRPYKCEYCTKAFARNCHLTEHISLHSNEKSYSCELCGRIYTQRGHLNQHLRVNCDDKPYKCPYCEKSFTQSNYLIMHTRMHSTGPQPYQCQICQKYFTKYEDLVSHAKTHEGLAVNQPTLVPTDKQAKCEICGHLFDLDDHYRDLLVFADEKRFRCPQCERLFPRHVALDRQPLVPSAMTPPSPNFFLPRAEGGHLTKRQKREFGVNEARNATPKRPCRDGTLPRW